MRVIGGSVDVYIFADDMFVQDGNFIQSGINGNLVHPIPFHQTGLRQDVCCVWGTEGDGADRLCWYVCRCNHCILRRN